MLRIRKQWVSSLAVLGVLAVAATQAQAGFTTVQKSKRKSEATHEQILERVYGGNFSAAGDGVSYTNDAGVTVSRLADNGSGQTDESWDADVQSAKAVASFARQKQSFGYFGGASGGDFTKMFDVAGKNFDVAGAATDVSLDGAVRFGRGENVGKAFSSLAGENRDGQDHLVSYQVTGLDEETPTFLLFWEDKAGKNSDWDYNDMVVEVQTAAAAAAPGTGEPLLIPVPSAAWTGLSGLLGLGAIAGFKKVRRGVA